MSTLHCRCGETHSRVMNRAGLLPLRCRYLGGVGHTFDQYLSQTASQPKDSNLQHTCQADLCCARATASKNAAITDIKCTAGMVCSHAVPGANKFISCCTPEQFALYDVLLYALLKERPVYAFVLDVNCRFSQHFKTRFTPPQAVTLFLIGWLHSKAGHGLHCQLEYNAMFAEDMGRCIGEQTEQLWVSVGSLLPHTVMVDMYSLMFALSLNLLHIMQLDQLLYNCRHTAQYS